MGQVGKATPRAAPYARQSLRPSPLLHRMGALNAAWKLVLLILMVVLVSPTERLASLPSPRVSPFFFAPQVFPALVVIGLNIYWYKKNPKEYKQRVSERVNSLRSMTSNISRRASRSLSLAGQSFKSESRERGTLGALGGTTNEPPFLRLDTPRDVALIEFGRKSSPAFCRCALGRPAPNAPQHGAAEPSGTFGCPVPAGRPHAVWGADGLAEPRALCTGGEEGPQGCPGRLEDRPPRAPHVAEHEGAGDRPEHCLGRIHRCVDREAHRCHFTATARKGEHRSAAASSWRLFIPQPHFLPSRVGR